MRANLWDLETVPDLGGFAAANDLVGKSDGEPLKGRELACKRLASTGLRRSRHLHLGLASRSLAADPTSPRRNSLDQIYDKLGRTLLWQGDGTYRPAAVRSVHGVGASGPQEDG
jgi:hypothetical protein